MCKVYLREPENKVPSSCTHFQSTLPHAHIVCPPICFLALQIIVAEWSWHFIHAIAPTSSSLLFIGERYSTVQIHHYLFIHSNVDTHLGCFQLGGIIRRIALNSTSLWVDMFLFLCVNPENFIFKNCNIHNNPGRKVLFSFYR